MVKRRFSCIALQFSLLHCLSSTQDRPRAFDVGLKTDVVQHHYGAALFIFAGASLFGFVSIVIVLESVSIPRIHCDGFVIRKRWLEQNQRRETSSYQCVLYRSLHNVSAFCGSSHEKKRIISKLLPQGQRFKQSRVIVNMEFFRVAAFVPLATQPSWYSQTPSLIPAGLDYIRENTILVTMAGLVNFVWSDWSNLFILLLILRYYRLVIHIFAYLFWYQATPVPKTPTLTSQNAHVIIPTVDPENADFLRCVQSVLSHMPGFVTIVTANPQITVKARKVLAKLPPQNHSFFRVMTGPMANKRHQITHVLNDLARSADDNQETIVVCVDDHVWWPSPNFLSNLIAPFEDEKVGIVATNKRVQRERGKTFADSFLNFIACIYLERHNFEMTAANAIDGGVFVVSGRTCAMRASIAMRKDFREGFTNEHFFFGMFGPLNPDDDNYITRYMVRNGFDIKVQNMGSETLMETTLGTTGGYQKFSGQLLRWARTQWRSNSASLFTDRSVWRRQPWSVHAIFITWFFNFALVVDGLILYLWSQAQPQGITLYHMLPLIWGSKMVKLLPFFWRNPRDLWLFPAYVLFAYFHSFIKLWTLITFWDHSWSGRDLKKIGTAPPPPSDDNDDDDDSGGDDDDGSNKENIAPPFTSFSATPVYSDDYTYDADIDSQGYHEDNHPTTFRHDGRHNSTFAVPSDTASSQSSASMSISSGSTPRSSSSMSSYSSGAALDNLSDGEIPNYSGLNASSTFTNAYTHQTPWGHVNTSNPHLTPANIRQSHSPTPPPVVTYPSPFNPSSSHHQQNPTTNTITLPFTTPEKPTNAAPSVLPTPPQTIMKPNAAFQAALAAIPGLSAVEDKGNDDFTPLYDNIEYAGEPDDFIDSPTIPIAITPANNYTGGALALPLSPPPSQKTQRVSSIAPLPFSSKQQTNSSANSGSQIFSSPTGLKSRGPKYNYTRDFLRGHDCGRMHADGTYVGTRGGLRCCQTPAVNTLPNRYVVAGRPRF